MNRTLYLAVTWIVCGIVPVIWAMPSARATHALHRARILGLGLSVGIAIAGCHQMTPRELAAQNAEIARRDAQRTYDDTYDQCLYRVTGPFAGADIQVMRECDRQARAASGMSAGTAETPKSGSGLQPASPVPNGETPNA